MENKFELLKKLGFSNEYLKLISNEIIVTETDEKQLGQFGYEVITIDTSEIVYPIIEKTEEPVNSFVN